MTFKPLMKLTPSPLRSLLPALLISLSIALSPACASNEQASAFEAEVGHRQTARQIVHMLDKHHYLEVKLDDELGARAFDSYLEMLDPGRMHFLKADIEEFSGLRGKFDDKLRRGDLDDGFAIYNRLHERQRQRMQYKLELANKGLEAFDFTKDEYLELDREDAPWPADLDEARDLWRRMVKNDALNLKLGDTPEKEISSVLEKRYSNRLQMLEQINGDDVFEYLMTALSHSYDPHTDYFPPRESENFDMHMRLSLEGIGALLQREDEYVKVVRLIKGGPAERGKQLQPADRIVGVGQGEEGDIVNVEGWRLDYVVDLIRGPKGSVVRLSVIPADSTDMTKTRTIRITRDTVKLEEQAAQKRIIEARRGETNYKIGVIELPTFYSDFRAALAGDPDYRSSTRDVAKLIEELKAEDIDALIVDLRNNGGGSLHEANELTGLFIPTGPVVQIRGAGDRVDTQSDLNPSVAYAGPLAVMVNRLSASASEIFAGAIQDYGRGIVIGSQTFGKGTVQSMNRLDPGQLKYTQAKYYRITGESTQSRGVIPDIEYPALIDKKDIGESALSGALPWDSIKAARYNKIDDLTTVVDYLGKRHLERIGDHPDFQYIRARAAYLEENRSQTRASLNEAERQKERAESEARLLAIENTWRKAKGLDPLKDYEELEAMEAHEDRESPSDGLLQEAGDILVDWLMLERKQVAKH